MPPTAAGERLWQWGTWGAGGAEPVDRRMKLLQFNMCGSACNEGGNRIVDALSRSILARLPDAVTLNEVCLAQADRLWNLLSGRGAFGSGCFGASTGQTQCPGDPGRRWYGNAVFTSGTGIGRPELIELPNHPSAHEQRNVTGMRARLGEQEVYLASAHLAPGSDMNAKQVAEVAKVFGSMAENGKSVILGGDFNALPEKLGLIYDSGLFVEVDDPNNVRTYKNRKIDYMFLSAAGFDEVSAKVTRSAYSDHRPLLGEARFL